MYEVLGVWEINSPSDMTVFSVPNATRSVLEWPAAARPLRVNAMMLTMLSSPATADNFRDGSLKDECPRRPGWYGCVREQVRFELADAHRAQLLASRTTTHTSTRVSHTISTMTAISVLPCVCHLVRRFVVWSP